MPLQRPLTDSVIVITGASSGIGAATAQRLAARGASVVLAARREAALREVATRCATAGGQPLVVPTDVSDPAAVADLADRAAARFGRIDGWVNNASVALYAPLHLAPLDEIRRTIEINLVGCLNGARAVLPHLRDGGGGVIINVSSVLGTVTVPYLGPYNISKHGVRALSASLRQDLRADGERRVSVCTVLPASIDTPFYRHAGNRTGRRVGPLPPVYPPEVVADTIIGVLTRPQREAYAGRLGHLLALQGRVAPGLTERFLGWYGERAAFRPAAAAPTSGNLFDPGSDPADLTDDWHGRARATARAAAGVAVAGAAIGLAAVAVTRRRR